MATAERLRRKLFLRQAAADAERVDATVRALDAFSRADVFLLQGVKCASPHHLQQWCALYPGHDAKCLLGVLYTWYEQLPEFRGVRVRRDDARGGVQRLLPLWRDCLIDVPVDFAELRKDDNALYFVHDNTAVTSVPLRLAQECAEMLSAPCSAR